MRINSGKYKNKQLLALSGKLTRPTSDKVRESIFDVLLCRGELNGDVLDLFAGSGALGVEALSRGCESGVFIEKNPKAACLLGKNLEFVREKKELYNTDWKVAVRKLEGRQFDYIFIDPPYALRIEPLIISEIISKNLLKRNGTIIVEHDSSNDFFIDKTIFSSFKKEYSSTSVTFLNYLEERTCVFPGSFNPFTLGHLDVIKKAQRDFDKIIVAIASITYKDNVMSLEDRKELAQRALASLNGVAVETFDGMLTDYLNAIGCHIIVRGSRDLSDYKYERNLEKEYKKMDDKVNMILYPSSLPFVSATKARTSSASELKEYLPSEIIDLFIRKRI